MTTATNPPTRDARAACEKRVLLAARVDRDGHPARGGHSRDPQEGVDKADLSVKSRSTGAIRPQIRRVPVDGTWQVSVRVERILSEGPTNASAPRHMARERRLRASPTVKDTTDV